MSLSIGIIGLPNVGKSTLFNALLKRQAALAANYPFATIEPNIGIVDVPDPRLKKLAELVKNEYGRNAGDREVPEKIIPAVIKFYDIAGLVKGAAEGEGLGNKFLSHIREVDAIVHVVRDFEDENVVKAGAVSPQEDIKTITTELILADLQSLGKLMPKIESDLKKAKTLENLKKHKLYLRIYNLLNRGDTPYFEDPKDADFVKDLNLLTLKPVIYVFNVNEHAMSKKFEQGHSDGLKNVVHICAKVESELCSFNEEECKEYMKELDISETGLDKIIKLGFNILGLQTFLTAGPKEVRAWTIKKGDKAPQAAGVIHTDFERGFISAEIVSFADLMSAGSWRHAKEKGLIRIEGKNYVMKDGDVVEFHFSV